MTYVPPEYMCDFRVGDEVCSLRRDHSGDHYLVSEASMIDLQHTAEEQES